MKVLSRSVMYNSGTPWTIALQAPLPMGFSRQEYWSGLPFPSPGDLPHPRIKPTSPALQADILPPGKEYACHMGDLASIPEWGRSPGEGNGYPLQYSSLENSMDCIVHGVRKSWTRLSDFHFHTLPSEPPGQPVFLWTMWVMTWWLWLCFFSCSNSIV